MIIVILSTALVATSIGAGLFVSKRKFNKSISNAKLGATSKITIDKTLLSELHRFEQLKINLIEVKSNIEQLDIPIPESLSNADSTESSLNKLSRFFEKYSKSTVGTEAFILSILPISQTGEALCSFASSVPGGLSKAFEDSVSALKDGFTSPSIDNINACLVKFCDGIADMNPHSIAQALGHHNYFSAILKPIKSGIMEMTGVNDALGTFSNSVQNMTSSLSASVESSINPTNFNDLDFSGHVPVLTIAISSFRELSLLIDNKTDAMTSLKNVCLDAAGAGCGGLVGAKTGAFVGTVFGPLGTLVGGIVGGIGGAIGGRTVTNNLST